jgi:hypothetical protein
MKKIIRLTETDLIRLVKKVIKEQETSDNSPLFVPLTWSYTFQITNRNSLGPENPPQGFKIISDNQNDTLTIIDLHNAPGNLRADRIRFDFEVILKFDPIYRKKEHESTKDFIIQTLSQRRNIFTSGTGFQTNQLMISRRGNNGIDVPFPAQMVSGQGKLGTFIRQYPITVDKMNITLSYSDSGAKDTLANIWFPPTSGTRRDSLTLSNIQQFKNNIIVINDTNFNGEIQY